MISCTMVISLTQRCVKEAELQLPEGSTIADAIKFSDFINLFNHLSQEHLIVGIWGRKCKLTQVLNNLDRIEIYRPLKIDPKISRRERFKKQGVRTAGLFINKRLGSKAGY